MNEQPHAEPEWDCFTQGCKQADTIDGLIGCAVKYRAKIKELEAALAQSDAEPKGIDLDDADRAYDKWAEHRNGQSRLDAFRAGVEFGLRHTAPPRPDASAGLLEAAEIAEEHAGRTAGGAQYALEDLAATLRARATDRSGE